MKHIYLRGYLKIGGAPWLSFPRKRESLVNMGSPIKALGDDKLETGFLEAPLGFTLLEVMVAIAILAISLTVLMSFTGNTMITSGRAEALTVATMLARQKMADFEIEIEKGLAKGELPEEKSEDGQFDEPFEEYSWKMELRRVELPAPMTGEQGSIQDVVGKQLTKEISQTVRELKLNILWKELGEEQKLEIVTHVVKL